MEFNSPGVINLTPLQRFPGIYIKTPHPAGELPLGITLAISKPYRKSGVIVINPEDHLKPGKGFCGIGLYGIKLIDLAHLGLVITLFIPHVFRLPVLGGAGSEYGTGP